MAKRTREARWLRTIGDNFQGNNWLNIWATNDKISKRKIARFKFWGAEEIVRNFDQKFDLHLSRFGHSNEHLVEIQDLKLVSSKLKKDQLKKDKGLT